MLFCNQCFINNKIIFSRTDARFSMNDNYSLVSCLSNEICLFSINDSEIVSNYKGNNIVLK